MSAAFIMSFYALACFIVGFACGDFNGRHFYFKRWARNRAKDGRFMKRGEE